MRTGLACRYGIPQDAVEAVEAGEEVDTSKPAETAMAAALRAGGLVEEDAAAADSQPEADSPAVTDVTQEPEGDPDQGGEAGRDS
jgi:hypothetical protein